MSGFQEYLAEGMAGISQTLGQVTAAGLKDIGDSYQEILLADASISAPDGLTGTMETTTDYQPEVGMSDTQLQTLVDIHQHEADLAGDLDHPEISALEPQIDMDVQ